MFVNSNNGMGLAPPIEPTAHAQGAEFWLRRACT